MKDQGGPAALKGSSEKKSSDSSSSTDEETKEKERGRSQEKQTNESDENDDDDDDDDGDDCNNNNNNNTNKVDKKGKETVPEKLMKNSEKRDQAEKFLRSLKALCYLLYAKQFISRYSIHTIPKSKILKIVKKLSVTLLHILFSDFQIQFFI